MQKIYLYLSSGEFFEGVSFGASGTKLLDLAHSTSMIGYEEDIFSPNFDGKALLFTMSEIGSVGVVESKKPTVEAIIVRNHQARPSSFLSIATLSDLITKNNVLGVSGVNTREILKSLNANGGKLKAVISTELTTIEELRAKL